MSKVEIIHTFISELCDDRMNIDLPEEINFNDPLKKSYQLDSISMFEVVVNLEEEYSVGIPNEDVEKISNMSLYQLSEYLESLKV